MLEYWCSDTAYVNRKIAKIFISYYSFLPLNANPLFFSENITKDILGLRMDDGMDPGTFRDILYKMIYKRRPLVRNTHEVCIFVYYMLRKNQIMYCVGLGSDIGFSANFRLTILEVISKMKRIMAIVALIWYLN